MSEHIKYRLTSAILFIFACFFPIGIDPFNSTDGSDFVYGYHALISGYWGFLIGSLGWVSNILLIPSWFVYSLYWLKSLSLTSLVLSLEHILICVFFDRWDLIGGLGSILWLASILMMVMTYRLVVIQKTAQQNVSNAEPSGDGSADRGR